MKNCLNSNLKAKSHERENSTWLKINLKVNSICKLCELDQSESFVIEKFEIVSKNSAKKVKLIFFGTRVWKQATKNSDSWKSPKKSRIKNQKGDKNISIH